MSAFISRRLSVLILLAACSVASGAALLLNFLFAEPRLGPLYDLLLKCRPAPPVAHEILLIDTDEIIEPDDMYTVLMILSEMGASDLIVEAPVLGAGSWKTESGEEIRRRFNDEYALLGRNIRNLFEAIRVGSVPPTESAVYVENLVELAERGRDRLSAALIRQEGAGSAQMAQAAAVFGTVLEAPDLRSPSADGEGFSIYSRPRPDRDGKLRRIAPLRITGPAAAGEPADNIAADAANASGSPAASNAAALDEGGEAANIPAADAANAPQNEPAAHTAAANAADTAGAADESGETANIPAAEPSDEIPAAEPAAVLSFLPAAAEHIIYRQLKPRWEESGLEYAERGPVLVTRFAPQGGMGENSVLRKREFHFPLDKNGSILIEKPGKGDGFRRLPLEKFRIYDKADRAMRRLLQDAGALGVYSDTIPERIPLILCDYAASLREELLQEPDVEKRNQWAAARADYISSLDEFLYGPTEMNLVNGYEEIIATEKLNDEGIAKLQNLRDELIRAFVAMREQHRELVELHAGLAEALDAAFCIMGPPPAAGDAESSIPESSALLANALITGRGITPGQSRYILFWSLIIVLIILVSLYSLQPVVVLLSGLAASLLCLTGFGWSFIISSYWIDPLIPAASCLAGTLIIFTLRLLIIQRGARRFRHAYGSVVGKACLPELIKAGRPPLDGIITARAAIIAVKNPGLLSREDQEEPVQSAIAAARFRGAVADVFKKAGAAILAFEGDMVLACFGSPPERVYLELMNETETQYGDDLKARSNHHPAVKAIGFVTELLQHAPPSAGQDEDSPVDAWRFGIDCGDCAFSWSAETGYIANGRPVVRARILASLTPRYHTQAIISDSVREQLNLPARKLSVLSQGDGESEKFYELPVTKPRRKH
jgi:class 3 adenylate cyclase